jgi:two-component system response regulator FlrC
MAREGLCVLIVEDDQLVRELLSDTLRLAKHQVAEAATAEEALELASGLGRLDVVVADVRLPRSSGFDVLLQVRRRWPGVPAVFVTGWRPDELEIPAGVEQPFRVLPKPLGAHDLLGVIADLAPVDAS